jgi:hypothetical protein
MYADNRMADLEQSPTAFVPIDFNLSTYSSPAVENERDVNTAFIRQLIYVYILNPIIAVGVCGNILNLA